MNLSQVFFAFCFGMLAAGITLYCGSIIPMMIWHSLVGISAFFAQGLMSNVMYRYYMEKNLLTMQNVFQTYGILSNVENGYAICSGIINILVLVVGIVLVYRAEKDKENRGSLFD
ncbi:MAG: hypothetical protein ACI4DO_02570 [Roseburia sp.]